MFRLHSNRRPHRVRLLPRTRAVSLLVLALLVLAGLGAYSVAQPANCATLVDDTAFDSGSGWQSVTSGSYVVASDFLTYRGAGAAHLAGVDNATDQLFTTLTLPVDKPEVTLTFWWQIHSEEESGEFDSLTVLVTDLAGNALRSLLTLGSDSASQQWQQSVLDLSEFAGQSIQLKFLAQTDSSLVTDFFVDDVTVTACGGAAEHRVFLPVTQR